ncbi:MAG: TRAP transporter large permease subunit [Bdellovibrio sp.]|nr:MAG: TRAP transporter large permease subunit [Bdellovibrio sp.]
MHELFVFLLFALALMIILTGFPVAFSLAGSALLVALLGHVLDVFDLSYLQVFPQRLFGIMKNETLMAVPLFVLMGVILEQSQISERLLLKMGQAFQRIRGGLGLSVFLVGALLAASTGIVGATVVTMGLISLPSMLKNKYSPSLASGIICASGTLGQIIPPSIILIILGDVISSAHQQAQLEAGIFSPTSVSVADLFMGAIFPGLLLVALYMVYVFFIALFKPEVAPPVKEPELKVSLREMLGSVLPPLILIIGVLGSILAGMATPTESASVGCVGALILTFFIKKRLSLGFFKKVLSSTVLVNSMVFTILIGASLFSLVFRGLEGDDVVRTFLMHHQSHHLFFFVMALMFLLGFFLDFFEITFVIVPIVGPVLLQMGFDPIWLGVMIALNLQTSFLTPPFGFSLFYFRGVAPESVRTVDIYKGVVPFIFIQVIVMGVLWFWPQLATWLPMTLQKTGAF